MKRLYRSRKYCLVAGICGGMGEFFQVDPTLIRLLFFCLVLSTGFFPLFFAYLVFWMLIPKEKAC